MKLEDSKKEVLERVGKSLGFQVSEEVLSPMAKRSVTSIAEIFRQLVVMKQLLMVEQSSHDRLGARLARKVTRTRDEELQGHIHEVESLQSNLDEKIGQAAKLIGEELSAEWSSPGEGGTRPPIKHTVVEQLKCRTCGANLKPPVEGISRCDYCGTEYAISDYLQLLGASLQSASNKTVTT